MKKVVHVLYSGLGGHSAVLFSLLEGGFLRSDKHFIVFLGVEHPPQAYLERCNDLSISWTYVPKISGKGHFKFIMQVRKTLSSTAPDLLFLHGLASVPSVILLLLLSFSKWPFVLLRETQSNKLKTKLEWTYLALAYQFFNRIIHLTEEAATGAERSLGYFYKSKKVSIIPNGLDTDFFVPAQNKPEINGICKIGMQSRLQSNKDHKTLLSAFSIISMRSVGRNFELHIAGDGETYNYIKQLIEEYGLTGHVKMHGMLNNQELLSFLQSIDVYVHCTHGETMSTAIMQAMSCGLPIIASNVSGVNNMVSPSCGFLYEPVNAANLAHQIKSLVADSQKFEELRRGSREHAIEQYSIKFSVEAFEKYI